MSQNVCIYFSDTGGGHRSAADAIEAGIRKVLADSQDTHDVRLIKDTIAEKSHPVNRFFVELYNYLLRHHQPLMKYYYYFLHILRPESGLNYALTKDYFRRLLATDRPSVVVSVHPMISHCTANSIKQNQMQGKTKLIVVVTDPNADLWRAWACPDADLIIVPNEVVKTKLLEWGVLPERIAILGMPIHPDFVAPPTIDRQSFLTHLGLAPDVMTICINAGWAGGGNMLKIYKALSQVERPLQCIFLCGHNTSLYEKAMAAAAESDLPTAVLPFHDCMADLMANIDMMVTKAGGLTTYQAVARRLPIVFDGLTEPMPQEKGTVEMLVSQKVASRVLVPEDIIQIVQSFEQVSDRAAIKLPTAYNLDLTDTAPHDIACKVLEFCSPPVIIREAPVIQEEPVTMEQAVDHI